jgi:hypothetical protein
MAREGFRRAATLPSLPLFLPITKSLTELFLASLGQKSIMLWHPSLQSSFADIIGVSAYLARSDRATQVFWDERWCQKRGKVKLCNSTLKTPDQFASLSHDTALARQRAIRVPFENLFPLKNATSSPASGGELFAAVTMLIHRDLESVGRGNDFFAGLQEAVRFMIQWEAFPEAFRAFPYSHESMKRNLNLFVLLFSVHTGTDFSWYYERFGFPITQETKNSIARLLGAGSFDSIAQAIDTLAGTQRADGALLNVGTGLKGLYYDRETLDDLKVSRLDPTINFDWGHDGPAPAIQGNTFSARWTGLIEPRTSGEYTFYTLSDDGVRLWVDGKKIIDNWADHPITEDRGAVSLNAGKKYPIQLEFYENVGGAIMKLSWSSKQQAKEIVPASQLYPL